MTYVVSDGSEEEVGKLVCGVKLEVVDDWGFGGRGGGGSFRWKCRRGCK